MSFLLHIYSLICYCYKTMQPSRKEIPLADMPQILLLAKMGKSFHWLIWVNVYLMYEYPFEGLEQAASFMTFQCFRRQKGLLEYCIISAPLNMNSKSSLIFEAWAVWSLIYCLLQYFTIMLIFSGVLFCMNVCWLVLSLQNHKTIQFESITQTTWSSHLAKMMGFVCESKENLVGKGENAGYQYFLLFLQGFSTVYNYVLGC